jgi:two-component sensor histidine kinase
MKRALLLLLLLLKVIPASAEYLYPRLSPHSVDSLKKLLWQSQPDTNRVILQLKLSEDLVAKHHELLTGLDSALFYSKQAQKLSTQLHYAAGEIRSLYVIGYVANAKAESTAGKRIIEKGIQLSKQRGDKRLEAMGWYYLGNTYASSTKKLAYKILCYQQAMLLYQQLGFHQEEGNMLKVLADMHLLQGDAPRALRELQQVLVLYRAIGYRKLHYTYDMLLAVHRQMGNYKEALRYGLASIESAKATQDTSDVGFFYWRVGMIYQELKQYDESINYYRKSLLNCQINNYLPEEIYMAKNISDILIVQNKKQQALDFFSSIVNKHIRKIGLTTDIALGMAECNMALKRYPEAEKYYLKLLVAINKKDNTNTINAMSIYQQLGKFYLLTGQYKQARLYLNQALNLNLQGGSLVSMANIHLLLFKADSAQAHYPAAIAHYQQYKALNDSVFSAKQTKQLANLQIQYGTKVKEQNIALLTKQNQVQQASLGQRELQRNALVIGAVLLALLLGVSYNRYRLKQRSNQQLETQQAEISQKNLALEQVVSEKEGLLEEKEWMLKEIHHRVKNNLQIISSLLNRQSHYLHDAPALAAIRESQNRVQAMALIHQKLYQSEDMACVDMQQYTQEIVDYLVDSFNRQASVRPQVTVAAVNLDVALATPIGLIINEAVTNSLKHAFPNNRSGIISIGLTQLADLRYELTIADNGVGLPPEFDVQASRSLGLTIIKGLSKQLHGLLSLVPSSGVRLSLQFAASTKH